MTLRTLACVALCFVGAGALHAQDPVASAPSAPADLVKSAARVRKSVVALRITPEQRDEREPGAMATRSQAIVSGFVFDHDGDVLTVGDEIQRGAISVELEGGRLYIGRLVGVDSVTNVGVVHFDCKDVEPLPAAPADGAALGVAVIGIGNPYGLGGSLSVGHVTGVGRSVESGGFEWNDLLQVSLPMNPGDQGGPVADPEGRVIGMLLTRYRPSEESDVDAQGIAFAMPIAAATRIGNELIELDRARPQRASGGPWLGVRGVDIQDPVLRAHLRLESEAGVLIEAVFQDSPASAVGLEKNDVLMSFAGTPIRGAQHLGALVRSTTVSQRVLLEVIRAGATKKFELIIGARP